MPGETPPSFSGFKFNTIGKNSLLSRLSGPAPQAQETSMARQEDDEQEMQDDDDLYIEMDLDSDTAEPAGRQPNLLARITDPHATFNTVPSTSDQVAGSVSGPALSYQTRRTSDINEQLATGEPSATSHSETPHNASFESREAVHMSRTRSGQGTSIAIDDAIAPGHIPLFAIPAIPLTLSKSSSLPTPPPSGSTVPHQNYHSTFAEAPLTPSRTNISLFSQFPYTPLTELLNEERAAWSEAWETKQSQAAGTSNSISVVSPVRAQASSPSHLEPMQREGAPSSFSTEHRSVVPSTISSGANATVVASRSAAPVQPSTHMDEVSMTSDLSTEQLVGEKNKADSTASPSVTIPNNSCASNEVPRSDTTSFSTPLKPTTSSLAETQSPSSQAVWSRAPRQERSAIADEPRQIPKIDNVDTVLDQQSSTRSPAAEGNPPRENELKALLKARRTSQGVESKDSLERNERRSLRDTDSVPPTPVSPSRPSLSIDQGLGSKTDFPGETGSTKVLPPLLAVRSGQPPSVAKDGSSPSSIHAPPPNLLSHNNHTSASASSYSENSNPVKRKPSTSPPPQRGKGVSETSKRQRRNDSRIVKEEADAKAGLSSQPALKVESSSLLPPTPTSAGPTHSFTANSSAANRKRSRSPAVKAEDDGGSNSVAVASSHPLKRPKVSRTGPGRRLKVEEEEAKIEELGVVNLPAVPHGLLNVPLPTHMKVEGSEDSTEAAPRDLVPRLSDLQSQITASQADSAAQLDSRIGAAGVRDSSFKQQPNTGNDSIACILAPEANTGLSRQNDERDELAHTSAPQLCTGPSEQQSGISAPHSQTNTSHNRSPPDEEPAPRQPLMENWNAREPPTRITVAGLSQSNVSQPGSAGTNVRLLLTNSNEISSREATQFDRRTPANMPSPRSDRRALDREVLQRGRSWEHQPRVVDHWSPPRPQSPLSGLVADTYRPFRSPSPARLSRRLSDDYRRQYDRERTPPRLSWNGRRRSSSRRRSMSPFRRSRSPPLRRAQAQPIYSHYSPSPPRRAIYSPSPPPRRASPRQEPSMNAPLPPKRQRADLSHSGISFQSRDNHDVDARPPLRNDITPPADRYYRSTEDPRLSNEVRTQSSFDRIRQHPPSNRVGGDMLGRRNAGPDIHEPARSQFGGNVPPAEHQVNPFLSLPSVPISDGRISSSGSMIQEYHTHDTHRNTRLPLDRIGGKHYLDQGRQEDRYTQLSHGQRARQTEVYDSVSNDVESSRGRQGNSIGRLPLLAGTPTSETGPSKVVAETLPTEPQNSLNRPALAESHLSNLENERSSLQGGNRYRYVDPIDHTGVGSMNEDDIGKAYDMQLGERNHGQAVLFSPPGIEVQSMQDFRQPSPHSAPIIAHAPVETRLLPRVPSTQGEGSAQSPQVVQVPPSTLEQNLAQTTKTTKITDKLGVTSNHRDLVNRIGIVESTPTAPVRKRREPALPNAVDASSASRPPSLVSRLGVSSVKETAQPADRFAAAPATFLPTPPLISRLRNAPEASGSAHPLPPKPVQQRPPGGGNGRTGLPPTPPPFEKPTLLGRMRSPGREMDLSHEQPHVGRSTGRGRGRGSGVTQNTTRAGRDSHTSSKPSLENRFS